jgi:hypothetical protein
MHGIAYMAECKRSLTYGNASDRMRASGCQPLLRRAICHGRTIKPPAPETRDKNCHTRSLIAIATRQPALIAAESNR